MKDKILKCKCGAEGDSRIIEKDELGIYIYCQCDYFTKQPHEFLYQAINEWNAEHMK